MLFLLMLPLGIFASVALLAGGVFVAVEIAERRRAGRKLRRGFRPIVIEGGRGKAAAAEPKLAVDARAEPERIRLVRSAKRP